MRLGARMRAGSDERKRKDMSKFNLSCRDETRDECEIMMTRTRDGHSYSRSWRPLHGARMQACAPCSHALHRPRVRRLG